nr:MAG TPA: hypothetical protein [Caudoviricetes sp.]
MTKTTLITDSKRRCDMAVGIVIGHIIGDAINELNSIMANDEARWITTKKQGKGGGGKKFLIDSETGVILKGGPKKMRGKPLGRAFENKEQRKQRLKERAKRAKGLEAYSQKRKQEEQEQAAKEAKAKRSAAAQKGVKTRKANIQKLLEIHKFEQQNPGKYLATHYEANGINGAAWAKTQLQKAAKVAAKQKAK